MRAYELGKEAHRGQFRDGGMRYFEHLRGTALILIELGVYDPDLLTSCFLHDVAEDNPTFMSRLAIATVFNDRVANIVVAVTKPKRSDTRFQNDEERHRFYFIRLEEADNDTLIVKLADRLHNMRTLDSCQPEKKVRKAKETVSIYLPLCDKLNLRFSELGAFFHKELKTLAEDFLP